MNNSREGKMLIVDLRAPGSYPPLLEKDSAALFDLGVEIAQTLNNITVRAPVGDAPGETVELNSRLLRKKGVAVF